MRGGLRNVRPETESGSARMVSDRGLGRRRGRQHGGGAGVELLGHADEEVGVERPGDFFPRECSHRPPVHAADDLADQVAEGDRVIAVAAARRPPRRALRQRRGHGRPVEQRLGGQRPADGGQPRAMAQEPAHRDVLLAGLGELGPVAGHRRVQVELAALGQHVGAERDHALGGRGHADDRVRGPRAGAGRVGMAAPAVHHPHPVEVHADGGARVAALGEVPEELLADRGEAGLAVPVDRQHLRTRRNRTACGSRRSRGPAAR